MFGSLSDPACLNPYAYVLDNPVSLADPTGLSWYGDAYDFLIGGPLEELQRWGSWLGKYVPGTTQGQEALEYYAAKYVETGNPAYYLAGCLAGLWTPDTWDDTTLTLAGGWKFGAGAVGSAAAKAGVCPARTAEAAAKYPKLAGRLQKHHIIPKHLGGDPNGPTVLIDAAYRQMITNAFRKAWPYGQGKPNPVQLREILAKVYSEFPLP